MHAYIMCICMYIHIYTLLIKKYIDMYVYIYREREIHIYIYIYRERERYIYIYIYSSQKAARGLPGDSDGEMGRFMVMAPSLFCLITVIYD